MYDYKVTVNPVLSSHSKENEKCFSRLYRLLQVESDCILQYFHFQLALSYHLSLRSFVLSSFEWLHKTGLASSIKGIVACIFLFSLPVGSREGSGILP